MICLDMSQDLRQNSRLEDELYKSDVTIMYVKDLSSVQQMVITKMIYTATSGISSGNWRLKVAARLFSVQCDLVFTLSS